MTWALSAGAFTRTRKNYNIVEIERYQYRAVENRGLPRFVSII